MSIDESAVNLEAYLEQVGQCRNQRFGRRYRDQFRDTRGSAELAMLAAPNEREYDEFRRAVAAMTTQERAAPEHLGDTEIAEIANGYILEAKATREHNEIDY